MHALVDTGAFVAFYMARVKKTKARTSPMSTSSPLEQEADNTSMRPKGDTGEALFDIVTRSQKSFRELIDSFDRIAFNLSLDGQFRVVNRQFADVLGLPFAKIVNHSIEEFIAEPTREELVRALPRFVENHSWSGVVRVRWRRHQRVRFYDCTLYAVTKNGEVSGISGLARDISEQWEAESRFADLFGTLQEGVYFASPAGEFLDVNPAAIRMLGYENKEELLKAPADRHFADAAERAALIAELQKRGFVRNRELSLRRKDGSLLHARNSSVAIRDAKGEFVRFQGSLVDITEREQMEKRLREEQEFVRRLIASFPDVIAVLDTNGRYTFVSPRVQEILGYTPEEFIGLRLEERPHPEDRERLLDFFRRLTSGETSFGTTEYRTAHKEGGWRTIRANASPLTNADGEIIGVVASARDVTESRRLEEQLLQSEKLAAVGQMVSGVAHELNNPLTAILGVSDLLRERAADDVSRRQSELIHQQARRAAELVQGLLMFSRPSRTQSQNIRATELIARALELRKSELQARHIKVQVDAAVDLPPVDVNPNHMIQVLVNLISNAEQAIGSARDYGQIAVRVAQADGKQEILLDDDGPGIQPDLRSKIFDPFFTTRRSSGGSGLGLTIALVIVKEHGGTIEAQNSPLGGARLRILLPVAKSAAPAVKSDNANKSARPRYVDLKGRSILVVDDEQGVREIIEEALKARGGNVSAVATIEEAWKRLETRDYDIVLCDLNLGRESGTDLFKQVSSRAGQVSPQFIVMTGELLDSRQISKLEMKGAHALQKPFQMSELISLVQQALSNAEPKINKL
jgi:PAS domain S-box-containing protein